ncbi:MAG: MBL fold metallo-hydrolase [Polyangiaceae bacterium]|nr:MBL fold metallo-hydrolase [Polyangiaceae bacterium]
MKRRLTAILGNSQRLDGGAMFGNAPRELWSRWVTPDDRNRIPLACRAMLIEEDERRILVEAGIGAFFDPALRERYGVEESEHVLLEGLRRLGLEPNDIDIVVLSHLHFDHAGGLLTPFVPGEAARLVFERAHFVVGRDAYLRAKAPHGRDRASFIPELPALLDATRRLEIVDGDRSAVLGPDYRFHTSEGHTPGLLLIEVPSQSGPVVFGGDLVPGRPWMHLPITMGYDRFPEKVIDEKAELLEDLLARGGRLFFTHDAEAAMSRVAKDERGRFVPGETWTAPVRLDL